MISVIVPIYNVENYLKPCLDSILASTYQDFELILVDDGSTDNSGVICDEYAKHDRRIIVHHQGNSGVAEARNVGLKLSKGEYITFVDSDDMIHPAMLEVLHNSILSGEYDLSMVFNRRVKLEDIIKNQPENLPQLTQHVINQEDYFRGMYDASKGVQFMGPCNKLFKKSLLDGLWFKNIAAEDLEWIARMCLKMHQGVLTDAELYYYVSRPDSLTRSQNGVNEVVVGRLGTRMVCLHEIPIKETLFRSMCLDDVYVSMVYTIYLTHGTQYSDMVKKKCSAIFHETITEYLGCSIALKKKIKNLIYYFCPSIYRARINRGIRNRTAS